MSPLCSPRFRSSGGKLPTALGPQSDWKALSTDRFDLIHAELVLQHIDPEPLRAYLGDFAAMLGSEGLLCVYGRYMLDDLTTPIWPIILEQFEPVYGEIPTSGDYHTHSGAILRSRIQW
jgi:hypothetical protein